MQLLILSFTNISINCEFSEDNRIKITSAEERDIFERGTFEVEELKDMKAADENDNK